MSGPGPTHSSLSLLSCLNLQSGPTHRVQRKLSAGAASVCVVPEQRGSRARAIIHFGDPFVGTCEIQINKVGVSQKDHSVTALGLRSARVILTSLVPSFQLWKLKGSKEERERSKEAGRKEERKGGKKKEPRLPKPQGLQNTATAVLPFPALRTQLHTALC